MEKKLGLALGGGAARGFAHIGVLKVLEEAGIEIDLVAGTSMGSLVGAFYCSGMSISLMEKLAVRMQRKTWMDLTIPRLGLIAGDRLEEMVDMLLRRLDFDQLSKPFSCVATDLFNGERVVLNTGRVSRAVRASCAIPGIFYPVEIGNRTLVDGGIVDLVPAEIARRMGADFVLSIDVSVYLQKQKMRHIMDVVSQCFDITSHELQKYRMKESDYIIHPPMYDVAPSEFEKAETAISIGEQTAREALPQLLETLEKEGMH